MDTPSTYGPITTQNLSVGTNSPTAFSSVQLSSLPAGTQSVGIQVSGTYTGALSVSGTIDGANWLVIGNTPVYAVNTGVFSANIASGATGMFSVPVLGYVGFRVDAHASVTGEADVAISAGKSPAPSATASASGPSFSTSVPQSASDTVVSANPGELIKVLVTSTGSAAINIWDNATTHTGTIIGSIPGSTAIGTVLTFNTVAVNGITVQGAASQPNITVFWI